MSRLPMTTAGTSQLTGRDDRRSSGRLFGQPLMDAERSAQRW